MAISTLSSTANNQPKWVTTLGALGVVWYAGGIFQCWRAYTLSINTDVAIAAGKISQDYGTALSATPTLVWFSFLIASATGLIGAALLAIKLPKAKVAFTISVISALIYYTWIYGISGFGSVYPIKELYIGIVVVAITVSF